MLWKLFGRIALRILGTDPEQAFDDLTLLAAEICGTPLALRMRKRAAPAS